MRPSLIACCIAFAALLFSLAARVLLDPYLGTGHAFVTVYAAVAISVWAGGWLVAAPVAILGYFAGHILFLDPRGLVDFSDRRTVVGMLAYLVICALVIAIGEAIRAARRRKLSDG